MYNLERSSSNGYLLAFGFYCYKIVCQSGFRCFCVLDLSGNIFVIMLNDRWPLQSTHKTSIFFGFFFIQANECGYVACKRKCDKRHSYRWPLRNLVIMWRQQLIEDLLFSLLCDCCWCCFLLLLCGFFLSAAFITAANTKKSSRAMYRLERVYKTRSTPGDCTTTHIHNTHQIYVLAQIDIIFLWKAYPLLSRDVEIM